MFHNYLSYDIGLPKPGSSVVPSPCLRRLLNPVAAQNTAPLGMRKAFLFPIAGTFNSHVPEELPSGIRALQALVPSGLWCSRAGCGAAWYQDGEKHCLWDLTQPCIRDLTVHSLCLLRVEPNAAATNWTNSQPRFWMIAAISILMFQECKILTGRYATSS